MPSIDQPVKSAFKQRHQLLELCAQPKPSNELCAVLSQFFSGFGEVCKVSCFQGKENAAHFLVGFASEKAAVQAANTTGCPMFGFGTVLVKVEGLNGHF